jgi:hypothetical protein
MVMDAVAHVRKKVDGSVVVDLLLSLVFVKSLSLIKFNFQQGDQLT